MHGAPAGVGGYRVREPMVRILQLIGSYRGVP
jgi:hypothetical protein